MNSEKKSGRLFSSDSGVARFLGLMTLMLMYLKYTGAESLTWLEVWLPVLIWVGYQVFMYAIGAILYLRNRKKAKKMADQFAKEMSEVLGEALGEMRSSNGDPFGRDPFDVFARGYTHNQEPSDE